MKYDLIVVGGGPGGLMAAKTAAEDGLKVVLVERKRDPTEIRRYCGQVFYIRKLSASKAGLHGDGYIDPVAIELGPDKTRFHFPVPGFSLDYKGPLKPYYNWIEVSPSKYTIYKRRDAIWGFFYQKEAFLAGLLSSAQKAGAEIRPETIGMGAENTPDGVKVRVRGKLGEETLEASRAIAADGIRSAIAESVGFNKKRQVLGSPRQRRGGMVCYEMEGIETGLPPFSWVKPCIPSINRYLSVGIGQLAGDKNRMSSASEEDLQKFMKHPNFAPWFRHARLVKKVATAGGGVGMRTPIKEPVEGNVVVVGDAGAPAETWIQGAVASAYMAVKAIKKELSGQKGYPEYIDWWQKAFYFHNPDYFRMAFKWMAMSSTFTCDEDVDYAYKLLQDKDGVPAVIIAQNLELFKEERPEFYERFKKVFEEVEGMVPKGES
ncbi:MAG: NAD(P)/FAD-dependent oxidoreductase [Dehalococcoidales bacterium]